MAIKTQLLRREHQELRPQIEMIASVADQVGVAAVPLLREAVDDIYDFLTNHLLPHAQAEEKTFYPVIGRLLGAPEATAIMSREHEEVRRLVLELSALRHELAGTYILAGTVKSLRRLLYGLYTLLKLHFLKEEEIYLPLLDANLAPDEVSYLMDHLEQPNGNGHYHFPLAEDSAPSTR